MHDIEPHYNWRHHYVAERDSKSPFYGRRYSEIYFTNSVYNYLIHPQWDEFGSKTLYMKILYCNYDMHFTIIELIGEWNDLLYNDIMYLYRQVIEVMIDQGICHFILIGENVLNFHDDGDDYYQEWFDNIEDGWIVCLNFREHVVEDFVKARIDYYLAFGGKFDQFNWRAYQPIQLFDVINSLIMKRLNP
ncbi:MAG: hypothetical protein CVT92_14885 [Bacteroidetes bacterium HGW-Bacteroidetes-1]|nr:MAG: hypothetical protein CVT92_14885 [Bacteroidetes bacterium HGW-Bacteroidetes-1]